MDIQERPKDIRPEDFPDIDERFDAIDKRNAEQYAWDKAARKERERNGTETHADIMRGIYWTLKG
jgi:hypothetical protein